MRGIVNVEVCVRRVDGSRLKVVAVEQKHASCAKAGD